jgi:single-strand DNA-binding protein
VASSVSVGDPVIVHGRIDTRDWKTEQGEPRMSYEVDAYAVGHDLARGRAVFTKGRGDGALVVEDADEPAPSSGHDEPPDDLYAVGFGSGEDSVDPADLRGVSLESTLTGEPAGGDEDNDEDAIAGADAGSGGTDGRSRRRGRHPVLA